MAGLAIKDFVEEVRQDNKMKGIYDSIGDPREYLAHIHSEVSEVYEELRMGSALTKVYHSEDGKPEGVPIELADVVLSCFRMAGLYGIDLEAAILEKHEYDRYRPFRHGKEL